MVILVANEPRTYREALAAELRTLSSKDDVMPVEPADLGNAIDRLQPDAVIASRPAPSPSHQRGWLVLYPQMEDMALADVVGHSIRVSAPDLALVCAFLTMVAAASDT
jgi:hypothetical protein